VSAFSGEDQATFQFEIAGEHFRHALADHKPAQILQIGKSLEEQDPLNKFVRVLHLVDGFLALVLV
jgi:hypothetical protein